MCQMLVHQYVVYGQGEVMEHDTYVTRTKVYKGGDKIVGRLCLLERGI